jgi:hypothetical protein
MPNLHWTRLGLCALLAATAMPLPAQPAAEVEGIYQDEVFEVASTLALSPSGRFLWVFSMGALDVAAEGRWTRESDGTIVLNSEPVLAPRFELVGRSRDDRPGIAVRLACDSREAARFLDVVVEYADGERVAHNFSELEYRTTAEDSPRPVAAVQVGSGAFDLISERVPVNPQEANVFTFRFIPNDLGRVEFRNQRVAVESGAVTALSLDWRGTPLRYTRESSAAGEELPRLPPMPNAAVPTAPVALEVILYEPLADLRARAGENLVPMDGDGFLVARGPVDLRLGYDGRSIDLGRVEGGRMPLIVTDNAGDRMTAGINFSYQPDLLSLDEALARARSLTQWLDEAGFDPIAESSIYGDIAPFTTMPGDGSEGTSAASWEEAARMLADDGQAIAAMRLYTLRAPAHMASLRLENVRRHEREVCPHSDWHGEADREWRLLVTLSPSLNAMIEESAPAQP